MKERLLILDGTSLVNEAYNATITKELQEANEIYNKAKTEEEKEEALKLKEKAYSTLLKSTSGQFINAVQEFFREFLEMLDKQEPSHVAVVWGTSRESNHKREIYSEYKNDGKKVDEPLRTQTKEIQKILNSIGVAQYKSNKYEAIDIAGSISNKYKDSLEVVIIARNKNALQLCEMVKVCLKSSKSAELAEEYNVDISDMPSNFLKYDKNLVEKMYGLTPMQYIDYRAIIGSSSSNIPGIKGIGEVTALPLIKYFGSIENMYKHINEVVSSSSEKELKEYFKDLRIALNVKRLSSKTLLEGETNALISKQLVKVKTDILVDEKQLDVKIDKVVLVKTMKVYDLANIELNDDDIEANNFSSLIRTFDYNALSPSFEFYVGDNLSDYIDSQIVEASHNEIDTVFIVNDATAIGSNIYSNCFEDDEDDLDIFEEAYEECAIEEDNESATSTQIILDEYVLSTEESKNKSTFRVVEVVTSYKYQCNHCNEYFVTEGKPAKFCPHCGVKNSVEEEVNIPVIEKDSCKLLDMTVPAF